MPHHSAFLPVLKLARVKLAQRACAVRVRLGSFDWDFKPNEERDDAYSGSGSPMTPHVATRTVLQSGAGLAAGRSVY